MPRANNFGFREACRGRGSGLDGCQIVGSSLGPDFDNLCLRLGFHWQGYRLRGFASLFNVLVARRPQFEKRLSFFVQTLALRVIEDRFSYDAIDLLRTEVVLIIETVDHL